MKRRTDRAGVRRRPGTLGSDGDDLRPARQRRARGPAAGADRDDLRPVRARGGRLVQHRLADQADGRARRGRARGPVGDLPAQAARPAGVAARAAAPPATACPPAAATILAEGDRRIFDRPRASAADGWLLAVFSVPEQERRTAARAALPAGLARLRHGLGRRVDRAGPPGRRDRATCWQPTAWPAYVSLFTRRLPGLRRRAGEDRAVVGPGPARAALPGVHRLGRAGPGALGRRRAGAAGPAPRRSPTTSGCSPPGGGCRSSIPACRRTAARPPGTACGRTRRSPRCASGWPIRPAPTCSRSPARPVSR